MRVPYNNISRRHEKRRKEKNLGEKPLTPFMAPVYLFVSFVVSKEDCHGST